MVKIHWKNRMVTLALVALLLTFAGTSLWLEQKVEVSARLDLPIYSVALPEGEKKAALTFDAAWGNEDTSTLIEILARYNVKATFFVIGQWAEKYPESVRELAEAGHDIMTHSYKHDHYTQLTSEQMIQDVERSAEVIRGLTGIKPILFRAPYGDYNAKVVESMKNAGYATIQWDVDSLDWKDLSAAEIMERVLSKTEPGSIILFHNAAKYTPEALPGIIEALTGDGYELCKVNDMIYKENYTMDHTGRQHRMLDE